MNETHSIIETWNISSRITLYVLSAIQPEALADNLGARAWSVGRHFAHLHNNRLAWMEQYPEFIAGVVDKIPGDQQVDKSILQRSLEQSAQAMTNVLTRGLEKGKISGFKRSVEVFIGYLIAHEAYHISEISVILTQCGHRLDKEVAWGIWEWDKR
jgi:uncharacterized damage-inducible protein DinB